MRKNKKWLCIVTALIATLTLRHYNQIKSEGASYETCNKNLDRIASAVMMYQTDNDGQYPSSLKVLQPKYLSSFPQCPSSNIDTYSTGYELSTLKSRDRLSMHVEAKTGTRIFILCCKGSNHRGHGLDRPRRLYQ